MKWRILFLLAFVPSLGHALNITGAYANDGGDKIPRDCFYPHCVNYSSSTINRFWDGHSITPFTAQGELTHFQVVAYNNNAVDAASVTVVMSSMSCASATGIVSVPVVSSAVTNLTTRPIRVYSAWYLQNNGMSSLPYGRSEYEARQYPLDMRVPCTVNGNNDCIPNGGTDLWVNRTMANLFLPVAWIPNEEFAPVSTSSYTVYHSSSMAWDVDVWTSSSIPAGTCTGTFSIYEGASLSTAMPVAMKVYGVQMPATPDIDAIVFIGNSDLNSRINGNGTPTQPSTGTYLSSRQAVAQLFKENGLQVQGDKPDSTANDYWSLEYSSNVSGETFTPALGYGNAPGVGQPNKTYVIGFYGSWQSVNWSTGSAAGAADFCTNVSSWIATCQANNANCVLYTPADEGSPTLLATEVASMTWTLQNNPRCSYNGQKMDFMQTGYLPDVMSSAPYTSWPTSTAQGYDNYAPSSTTWQTIASSIIAGNGSTDGQGQVWRYNESAIGSGAVFPYEEEGYVPQANFWAYWKKLCANGNCSQMGYMLWEGNYWTNSDNGAGCGNGGLGGGSSGNRLDVYHNACTFGYATGANTQWGMSGFDYCQGDGVLSFPGTDAVYPTASFGVNGAFPTYTLKQIGVGIDTVHYLNAAYAVNPTATMNVVNAMYPKALWEVTCFNPTSDCTYTYGDRTWSYGADNWARARESLLVIALGAQPVKNQRAYTHGGTTFKGSLWVY